jgi:hypothetical protein
MKVYRDIPFSPLYGVHTSALLRIISLHSSQLKWDAKYVLKYQTKTITF